MRDNTNVTCRIWYSIEPWVSKGPGSIPGATRFFREVAGLERGSLNLVSKTEELLERKSSAFGLENQNYGLRDPPCWPHDIPLSSNVGTKFADYYYWALSTNTGTFSQPKPLLSFSAAQSFSCLSFKQRNNLSDSVPINFH
jgi:hypothetical protein